MEEVKYMKRNIKKHNNILNLSLSEKLKSNNQLNELEVECRGCNMKGRELIWESFVSSISFRNLDNSYLTLEEELDNKYDPNAVMVVVRGEMFGMAGYIGKEFTNQIKGILNDCKEYRLDMKDKKECGKSKIKVILKWSDK